MGTEEPEHDSKGAEWIGIGLSIGAGLGVTIGAILDNVAMGITFGAALGMLVGAVIMSVKRSGQDGDQSSGDVD